MQDGYLTITAAKNLDKEEKEEEGRYIRQERYSGRCSRSFYVGEVKADEVSAKYQDGILRLTVPKKSRKSWILLTESQLNNLFSKDRFQKRRPSCYGKTAFSFDERRLLCPGICGLSRRIIPTDIPAALLCSLPCPGGTLTGPAAGTSRATAGGHGIAA